MLDRLADVALFADLDRADLQRLCREAREVSLAKGEQLFAEGDAGEEAYVITEGELEILKQSVGRDVLLAVRQSGDVIGEMSLLEEAPRMASVRARSDVKAIAIQKAQLDELLETSQTAARAMFGVLLARWRETESRLRQSERMAQLGTLTAGLAHELNNPASAVKRAAADLAAHVDAYADARAAAGEELPESLATALASIADRGNRPKLDPVSRSDAEAEVEEWLTGKGVADPWDVAPALVAAGLGPESLEGIEDTVSAVALLTAAATAHDLLFQVGEGSGRVFDIVQALKSYSFLDRAPIQDTDIVKGIEDTLLILRSKLGDIEVKREFSEVPPFPAYGAELNQVWTNLIDNAADAVGESGTITLRAGVEGDTVAVEVEDDGPGIPDDVVPRIFDSFFTTKEPGKGTGLGLDITYGIVVNRHGGEITVDTEPGRTVFRVTLPLQGPPS